jgi:predicted ester cyclase
MSATEENKAIALRWGKVWHQDTLDDLDAIFAPDFVDHALSGEGTPGLDALKARCRLFKGTFPDLTCAYQHLIAEGEYVVMHWLASGTHQGEFLGYSDGLIKQLLVNAVPSEQVWPSDVSTCPPI